MTRAEELLCNWQYKRTGGFFTKLFECIANADGENQARLAAGFPEEVRAYQRFHLEEEYWPKLEAEYIAMHTQKMDLLFRHTPKPKAGGI